MDSTISRFYFEKDSEELDYRKKLVANILQITILSTIVINIIFFFVYFLLLNYKLIPAVNQTNLFLFLISLVFTKLMHFVHKYLGLHANHGILYFTTFL